MEFDPSHLLVLDWASHCRRTNDSSGETGIIRSLTSTSAAWFMKLTGETKGSCRWKVNEKGVWFSFSYRLKVSLTTHTSADVQAQPDMSDSFSPTVHN